MGGCVSISWCVAVVAEGLLDGGGWRWMEADGGGWRRMEADGQMLGNGWMPMDSFFSFLVFVSALLAVAGGNPQIMSAMEQRCLQESHIQRIS